MNLTKFPLLKHAVLCLSILTMSSSALSFLLGQNPESAQETGFLGTEHQAWLKIQSDPSLDDYEKIKSTVTTYFGIVFENWLEKKWHDFDFLFDRTDPVAMADCAYERGFHQVWIARWRDYGIQMISYDFQPRYVRYSEENDRAKTAARAEAKLRFSDNPKRSEPDPLGYLDFSLIKKDNKWLLNGVRSDNPGHNVFPRGADFDKLVEETTSGISVIETESEIMQSLKKVGDPTAQERLKIMDRQLDKPHALTLQAIKTNFKFYRIESIHLIDRRYALVKIERPGEPSWFYFFDLVSGEKQPLFTNFYFAQLQEIRDPYCYIFHADGTVSEYDAKDFPLLIECSRVEEGAPFKSEFKARYLRVDEETEFGRRSHILILDVKVTVQGIEISFGPMKGHEDMFYADFVDIPVTKTSYKKEKNQFIISFMNTAISESVTLDNGHIEGQNMFIKSANLVSDDGSCRLIIDLADSVRYYRGFRKELNSGIPYALFTFHFEEDVLKFGPDPAFQ